MPAGAVTDSHGPKKPVGTAASEFSQAWVWLFNVLQSANVFFSLKTFGAAVLALYISFRLDLSQPSWALMTVYIVSQPLSGMMISKAIARVVGTLVGAVVGVALVAVFHNAQPLFVLCIAGWLALCLYCSIQMRELPGAYGAMLSGYTAAIIGLGAITAPETTFDFATARCLEILIGIACATLASRLVLPRPAGRLFKARVAGTLADMTRCIVDILKGHYDDARGLAGIKKLIADSLALESLRIHASRDTDEVREADKLVRVLQGRLHSLSSLLISVQDRLTVLRRERPAGAAALEPLLARVAERIETLAAPSSIPHSEPSNPHSPSLTGELLARLPDFEALRRDPALVLEYNIILRLIDILAQWQEINRLGALFLSGKTSTAANLPAPPPEDTQIARYRDHSLALMASVGVTLAVVATSMFWVFTGWTQGGSAVVFAGVISCLAAQQDNPAAGALRILKVCGIALAWALLYLFAILPRIHGFDQLVLAIAPLYIGLGMLIPTPRFGALGYSVLVFGSSFMAYHNTMAPNFADILNSSGALMAGVIGGALGFRLLRPVGVEWALRRHTKGLMSDLADIATATEPEGRSPFESRMLDRINAVMLRLRIDRPSDRKRLRSVFTALRVGLNIRYLAGARAKLPGPLAASVREALDSLGVHFRALRRSPGAQPGTTPFPALDLAIATALESDAGAREQTINTLVCLRAIRATLAQHAGFYRIRE